MHPTPVSSSKTSGFSLIELSLVLVVIGLLVAGIIYGQSLIRAAGVRAVVTEYQRFTTITNNFKVKYGYYPGDMPNATRFWGAQTGATTDGVVAACANLTTAATGTATCNGDGSGFIADGCLAGDVRDQWYEAYRYWQHLSNAGLMEGQYVGNSEFGRVLLYQRPGRNSPKPKIAGGASWLTRSFVQTCPYSPGDDWFTREAGHFFIIGNNSITVEGDGPEFTPEEAWSVDAKIDDRKPGLGNVRTMQGVAPTNPGCTLTGVQTTDYALTNTGKRCTLILSY